MGSLFDTIKAALASGNPKSLAAQPSVAGSIAARAAAPADVADAIENGEDPNEALQRRIRQHSDHTGNAGK